MGSVRGSLFLAVLAAASALAVAVGCSAPYRAKDGLPTCDDGDPSCNGDSNQTPRRASSTSSGSSTPDTPEPTDPEPTSPTSSQPDAGADAAAAAKQPSCAKLEKCCDQLKLSGYMTDTCLGVVTTNNNSACYAQHKLYVEGGDCSW